MQAPATPAPFAQASNARASDPTDADLDALLAKRDWNGLGAALSGPISPDAIAKRMGWLQARIDTGGGLLLAEIYARDLWFVGNAAKTDGYRDLRLTAGLMSLYSYELIVLDGVKCADRTAPIRRLQQLNAARADTMDFLKKQSPAMKDRIVEVAVALERKTAPLRADDDLICRGGTAEMKAGLEQGEKQEVTPAPGQAKRVVVTPPEGWTPPMVTAEVYEPLRETARAGMRDGLRKFIN
jgi:hypothetical protein